jgi:antitoxin PrlF
MPHSRLTKKRQATIPKDICVFLHLDSGDTVSFDVTENQEVVLRKSSPLDIAYVQALEKTLEDEWLSSSDSAAFDDM